MNGVCYVCSCSSKATCLNTDGDFKNNNIPHAKKMVYVHVHMLKCTETSMESCLVLGFRV